MQIPNGFIGRAQPLTIAGLRRASNIIGCDAATILAVLDVETRGCGYFPTKQPAILFERHKFYKFTNGKHRDYPDICNLNPGGYGPSSAQYARLDKARNLNAVAALDATSWGLAQIMGFNARAAGYDDATDMIAAFCDSENAQLESMTRFCVSNNLDAALRARNWAAFAFGYNGENYAINNYDKQLANRYAWNLAHTLDFGIRAAQVRLMFEGIYTGRIDGIDGPATQQAMAIAKQCGVEVS